MKIKENQIKKIKYSGLTGLHTQGLVAGWAGVQVCTHERERAGGDG